MLERIGLIIYAWVLGVCGSLMSMLISGRFHVIAQLPINFASIHALSCDSLF